MGPSDERDEAITEARIAGISTRALAKQHHVSNREISEAVDRRLDYKLDHATRLQQVKLNVARLEALMAPFFERATKDRDVLAGTLCVKIAERLSLLLGLDHPAQSRIDVYRYEASRQPSSHERIREAIYKVARGHPAPPVIDGNGQAEPAGEH